jgi:hypothetical protein
MKHLTKRNYGRHIGGIGITIPESGYGHGFPEPQRNVWKSRKWTTEQAEAQQEAEYWLRLVKKERDSQNTPGSHSVRSTTLCRTRNIPAR